jgi:hypothetical protein
MQWGDTWVQAGTGAPIVLVDRKTGRPIADMKIRNSEGQALQQVDIRLTAGPGATKIMRQRLGAT